jgi:hypothetical protein
VLCAAKVLFKISQVSQLAIRGDDASMTHQLRGSSLVASYKLCKLVYGRKFARGRFNNRVLTARSASLTLACSAKMFREDVRHFNRRDYSHFDYIFSLS